MTQDPRRTIAHLGLAAIAARGHVTGSEIASVSPLERLCLGSLATAVQRLSDVTAAYRILATAQAEAR
jgi:hypothetical protein